MKKHIAALVLAALSLVLPASATTILKFGFDDGPSGPDGIWNGSEFSTINDPGQSGQLTSGAGYGALASLGSFTDAVISFTGIMADGAAYELGGVVYQKTTGGTFSFTSAGGTLGGVIDDGLLFGSSVTGSGSLFSTDHVTFTSGTLLSKLVANSGSFSLGLLNVTPTFNASDGHMSPFNASLVGEVGGAATATPEPGSLLLSGLGLFLVGAGMKRFRRAPATNN